MSASMQRGTAWGESSSSTLRDRARSRAGYATRVARQPELVLKLLGRDPRMMRGDEVGRPEPCAQRRARRVHHGPGRQRGLLPAALALPDKPAAMHLAGLAPATRAKDEPLRPARRERVLTAVLLGREALLELHDRTRETRPRHPVKLSTGADGTNRISTTHKSRSEIPGVRAPLTAPWAGWEPGA